MNQREIDEFRRQWQEEIRDQKAPQRSSVSSTQFDQLQAGHLTPFDIAHYYLETVDRPSVSPTAFTEKLDNPSPEQSDSSSPTPSRKVFKRKSSPSLIHIVNQSPPPRKSSLHFLDQFIADIDELESVPFFDISLPREVALKIFRHLSVYDLLSCCLVSKSWRRLAEDNSLWRNAALKMGVPSELEESQKLSWKQRIARHVEEKNRLEQNWRLRQACPSKLDFVQGGVLCYVTFAKPLVLAGYSSCDITCWCPTVESVEADCRTYRPPVATFVVDEQADFGLASNSVACIARNGACIAAGFSLGNVVVWRTGSNLDNRSFFEVHRPTNEPVHNLLLHFDDADNFITTFVQNRQLVAHFGSLIHEPGDSEQVTPIMTAKTFENERIDSAVSTSVSFTGCSAAHQRTLFCAGGRLKLFSVGFQRPSDVNTAVSVVDTVAAAQLGNLRIRGRLGAFSSWSFSGVFGSSCIHLCDLDSLVVALQPFAGCCGQIVCLEFGSGCSKPLLVCGAADNWVRCFDPESPSRSAVASFGGHEAPITAVQMTDTMVLSGDRSGYTFLWDRRAGRRLWELHSRHPVRCLGATDSFLVVANIPDNPFPATRSHCADGMLPNRFRGSLYAFDFRRSTAPTAMPQFLDDEFGASRVGLDLRLPYDAI